MYYHTILINKKSDLFLGGPLKFLLILLVFCYEYAQSGKFYIPAAKDFY